MGVPEMVFSWRLAKLRAIKKCQYRACQKLKHNPDYQHKYPHEAAEVAKLKHASVVTQKRVEKETIIKQESHKTPPTKRFPRYNRSE